ncbi:hypothetical protein [Lentzea sp. E54]
MTFAESEAEATDKDTIDALRGLPTELGLRAAGGRPSKEIPRQAGQ